MEFSLPGSARTIQPARRQSVDSALPSALCIPRSLSRWYLIAVVLFGFGSRFTLQSGGSTIRIEYVLAAIALALLFLSGRLPRLSLAKGWPFLLGWLTVNVISSLTFAPDVYASLRVLALLVLGAATLILIAYLGGKWGVGLVHVYLKLWFIAVVVGLVGSGADLLLGTSFFSERYTDVVTYLRIRGTFWEPNFYGIAAMMLGIVLWDEILTSRRPGGSRRTALRFLVCFVAVLLSGTRSAQIVFVLGLAANTLIRGRLTRAWLTLSMLLASVTVVLGGFVVSGELHTPYTDRIVGTLLDPQSSSSLVGRINMYGMAWEQMGGGLALGYGTNAFGQFNPALNEQGQAIYGRLGSYLGSFPLSVLYDTGLIGVLMVLGWLVSHHWAGFYWSRVSAVSQPLWSFTFVSILMFLCFFTTNGILLSFPWVHMGVTTVLMRIARESRGPIRLPSARAV